MSNEIELESCKNILSKHRERWVRDQLVLMECRDVANATDDETLFQAIARLKSELDFANRYRASAKAEDERKKQFSAYKIPIGTEFVLGKRRWCLVVRMEFNPDFLTFREVSQSPHTPDRIFNPSEIDALHELGVVFRTPALLCDCGRPNPRGVCDWCHPVMRTATP